MAAGLPRFEAVSRERHLNYRWSGERVDRFLDYARDQWIGL
jgi:hypothetical protein